MIALFFFLNLFSMCICANPLWDSLVSESKSPSNTPEAFRNFSITREDTGKKTCCLIPENASYSKAAHPLHFDKEESRKADICGVLPPYLSSRKHCKEDIHYSNPVLRRTIHSDESFLDSKSYLKSIDKFFRILHSIDEMGTPVLDFKELYEYLDEDEDEDKYSGDEDDEIDDYSDYGDGDYTEDENNKDETAKVEVETGKCVTRGVSYSKFKESKNEKSKVSELIKRVQNDEIIRLRSTSHVYAGILSKRSMNARKII